MIDAPESLQERLAMIAELLPEGATITLGRETLLQFSTATTAKAQTSTLTCDLSVADVAKALNRSQSTVRALAASGRLPGAYRSFGREWRIPRDSFDSFREQCRQQGPRIVAKVRSAQPVNIGRWRDELKKAS
jgi:excisionase family DNA binding protein